MTSTTDGPKQIQRYKIGYRTDEWGMRSSTPSTIPDPAGPLVKFDDAVQLVSGNQDTLAELEQEARLMRARMERLQAERDGIVVAIGAGGVQALSAAPAGWKLVPVEPTNDMQKAADEWAAKGFDWPKAVYRAMLAASPTPPAEQQGITPETGNSVPAQGAAITSESGTPPAEQQATPKAAPGEPVHGDVLPPVGSRVYIRHGRDNDAHACTVTGYYAWGDLGGDKRLHRVFVRLVYEGTDRQQARMLCDCYPTAEAALAEAAPQQEAQEPDAFSLACEVLRIYGGGPHTVTCNLDIEKPESLAGLKFLESVLLYAWRLGAKAAPQPAPAPMSEQAEEAAMYRWLRAQHEDDSGEPRCCVYAPNDMRECLVPVGDMPGELDAFIRAALAAQGESDKQDQK